MSDSLLRVKPALAEKLGKQGDDPVVRKEHAVLAEELAAGLERLELALELGDTDDARDEFDVVLLDQVLILPLGILDEQADGCRAWVDDRVGERAVSSQATRQLKTHTSRGRPSLKRALCSHFDGLELLLRVDGLCADDEPNVLVLREKLGLLLLGASLGRIG